MPRETRSRAAQNRNIETSETASPTNESPLFSAKTSTAQTPASSDMDEDIPAPPKRPVRAKRPAKRAKPVSDDELSEEEEERAPKRKSTVNRAYIEIPTPKAKGKGKAPAKVSIYGSSIV